MSDVVYLYKAKFNKRYSDIKPGDIVTIMENKPIRFLQEGIKYKVFKVESHKDLLLPKSCNNCVHGNVDIVVITDRGTKSSTCDIELADERGIKFMKG